MTSCSISFIHIHTIHWFPNVIHQKTCILEHDRQIAQFLASLTVSSLPVTVTTAKVIGVPEYTESWIDGNVYLHRSDVDAAIANYSKARRRLQAERVRGVCTGCLAVVEWRREDMWFQDWFRMGIWYIHVIHVYFFNRSQNKWFCLDSTTHSNPTGRASAVVSPLGSASLRSPSKSASLQTASHKRCNFAQDRIPPPPIKYVPGSGAVIARVYIMYEALGLHLGCVGVAMYSRLAVGCVWVAAVGEDQWLALHEEAAEQQTRYLLGTSAMSRGLCIERAQNSVPLQTARECRLCTWIWSE